MATSTIERTKQERLLYERLVVFQDDLRQAAFYAGHLLKKNWHFDPWDSKIRWTTYMQQAAFTTALVTAYGRPFAGANGFPTMSMKLAPYDSHQLVLHHKLRNLRNNVYAHSDVALHRVRPVAINGRAMAVVHQPSLRLTKAEVETVLEMTRLAIQAIDAKLQNFITRVQSIVDPSV
mgnify:CR=1 FL=1